jgi:hypothetical protein
VVLPQIDPTRVSAPEDWHAFISDMSGVTVRKDARIIVQYIRSIYMRSRFFLVLLVLRVNFGARPLSVCKNLTIQLRNLWP